MIDVPALQPVNPLGAIAQAQQLRASQQEMAMRNQAMQQQSMQMEQQQRAMDSQNALMKAYTDANGDLSKAVPLAAKYGALPGDVITLQQSAIEQKQKALELVNAQGTKALRDADLMQGMHDQIAKLPPEQRPAAWQQGLQQLQAAQVDISGAPQQYPGDQAFAMMGPALKGHAASLEEAAKQIENNLKVAQTGEATAKGAEATAQAYKLNQEAQYGPTGPAAEAKYRFILSKAQSGKQLSPDEVAFAKGFEASNSKSTTQSDSLGVTSVNSSRPNGLAITRGAVPPANAAAPGVPAQPAGATPPANAASTKNQLVDMIGNYKYDAASLSRLVAKHPDIIAAVGAKYPDFDQTTYMAKNKLIQNYTSGPQSREINAINTAMGHISDLDAAVNALNNGDITTINKIGNKIGINLTGQTPAAAFQLIARRVGPEIAAAYIPGGGGEGERIANEKDFDASLPPQTLHNNAAITVQMLRSKIGALENQYKNTVGRDDFTQKFITPQAQQAIQRFAPQQGGAQQFSHVSASGKYGWDGTKWVPIQGAK